MRRKWAVVPGLVALAATAALLSAYSGASSPEGYGPDQPIAFPHPTHVQGLGMNCLYCHVSANKAPDPGLPAVNTCMGCHAVVGPQLPARTAGPIQHPAKKSAELAKLVEYWNRKQPIPWKRIHRVPDYVNFPHMRHVTAGVTCQTCHGRVQEMQKVFQQESLNMGWCIRCHVNGYSPAEGMQAAGYKPTPEQVAAPRRIARYDCSVCHY